ncbi:PREDICTED: probable 28S rRNA (cytosine-C(5))-methyltransferase [Papilio polytes]|uniref:probable 28S rRNA (cytosine-C(5))-methyltransferase n=1 Tax=Papilio polytes TaxID=76194 RepID=UPI000676A6F5|nr:PREDICTED: probable 28S rRNA (cytosine-C(5))-methyltransferase [Papilio polytes]
MFEHSIKVPRHYKIAANILKKVSTEGGSVKTLLYDNKLRHFRTNVLFALITETIKHAAHIDKIFDSCSLLKNESRLDPWLAKILTAELLFGKKSLPGKSKPEQTILSYKEQFEKYTDDHEDDLKSKVVRRPRYVRVNTNLLTTSDAIRAFQDEEYRFIRCTSGSYDDYLKQIQNLTEYDFTQDYHVKTVFVFAPGTKFHEHELYLENKLILQDKATALAVHLLAAPSGSVALDMCAAPGMKTTQLAAFMRNEGKIYAVERNEQRYKTLCEFVEKTGSKCVETLHKDSLEIKRGDYDDVEYILLDPSCSGSGMEFCVHNYIEETRLAKLTSLQEKFLKHAMNSFPKAKRIVYSTCSLYPEENERVITNVVKTSRAKWRVQDVKELLKGEWNNFGSGMYGSIGTRCLYAKPDTDLTTGFFLAVLDRDQKDLEKKENHENNPINEGRKGKKNKTDQNNDINPSSAEFDETGHMEHSSIAQNENDAALSTNTNKKKNKSKKDKKDDCTDIVNDEINTISDINEDAKSKSKKESKKNIKLDEHEFEEKDNLIIDTKESSDEKTKKKKKKRDKTKEINNTEKEDAIEPTVDDDEGKVQKKKRKRNSEQIIDESNTDCLSDNSKSKKEKYLPVENTNATETEEPKKKKKKSKH